MTKKGIIFIILGILCLIGAGVLITINNYNDSKAAEYTQIAYEKIQQEIEEAEENIDTDIKEMKLINIDGENYIGTIEIPALNLNLPVMADWDYKKMKKGPCRYYGSIITNDLVICGHSYKKVFGRIKNLVAGDLIIFTDMNNNEYIYKVELVEILSPKDIQTMINSGFDLTLYTCTNDSQNRVTVRLNRV